MNQAIGIVKDFALYPVLAHIYAFAHRHKDTTPEFHKEMIELFHSGEALVCMQAFRGGAKSTTAEECCILEACYGMVKNVLVIGSSFERAAERVRSIRHELETNANINNLFGDMRGDTWTDSKIILKNGTIIHAYGRGQSLRGVKHLNARPDFCLVDDFEEEDCIRTEEARKRTLSWFMQVLLPAMDKYSRVRVIGTPLHPESALMKISQMEGVVARTFPIIRINAEGKEESAWAERFPLEEIHKKRDDFERMGLIREFGQEYMCIAEEETVRPFKSEHIRVEPIPRSWHPVYAMVDPARTVGPKSAHTGYAVWSWIGTRLQVWDAWGGFYHPDEIISQMFDIHKKYNPIMIGVEEDGLNEFILQPLRQECAKRGVPIPFEALKAPRGKLDFIKSLQPFFYSGEVVFNQLMPELTSQLLNFPHGKIDVPNALAYAMKLGKGIAVYENFSMAMIRESGVMVGKKCYLAVHHENFRAMAAVVQYVDGIMYVIRDYAMEGDAQLAVQDVVRQAMMDVPEISCMVLPLMHFDQWRGSILPAIAKRFQIETEKGVDEKKGREIIRELMKTTKKGFPCIAISPEASWTLRAISGGYSYKRDKNGLPTDTIAPNLYATLMLAIESLCGRVPKYNEALRDGQGNDMLRYSYTKSGRKYLSALSNG